MNSKHTPKSNHKIGHFSTQIYVDLRIVQNPPLLSVFRNPIQTVLQYRNMEMEYL